MLSYAGTPQPSCLLYISTLRHVTTSQPNRKIVFFDNWTKGIHNLLPIAEQLSMMGWQCLLVHYGSWGPERGRPKEEVIGGLLCRDISFYGTRLLYNVIKSEAADVVLILNTNFIINRAIILAARSLGVRSCYLMHGILIEDKDDLKKEIAATTASLRKKRWGRVWKFANYTIPNYLYSGFKSDSHYLFKLTAYRVLWKTFRYPETQVYYPDPSTELNCDIALVWANIYVDFFNKTYGYPVSTIKVVGHPPLDRVFAIVKDPPGGEARHAYRDSLGLTGTKPFVVYLEGCFVEFGYKGWTHEGRLAHLQEMVSLCKEAGRAVVIKLHPLTRDESGIEDAFRDDPLVRVVRHTDLPLLLYMADSVICHISTTVNIAVAYNRPVFVPTWGISSDVSYYYVIKGVGIGCSSPESMLEKMRNQSRIVAEMSEARRNYMDKYISKYDGRSIDRIVDAITAGPASRPVV
jgi:hypothetical protein